MQFLQEAKHEEFYKDQDNATEVQENPRRMTRVITTVKETIK